MIFVVSILWVLSLLIVWRLGFKLGYNLLELEKDEMLSAMQLQNHKMYEERRKLREEK